jgi:hypothetical protein
VGQIVGGIDLRLVIVAGDIGRIEVFGTSVGELIQIPAWARRGRGDWLEHACLLLPIAQV